MKKFAVLALTTCCFILASRLACATEGGGTVYPVGVQTITSGLLFPPGDYLLNYNNWVHANALVDNSGRDSLPGARLRVQAHALRYMHIFDDLKLAGGDVALEADLAYSDVSLHSSAHVNGEAGGVGDLTIGPSLGWHSPAFHQMVSLLVTLPTGDYDRNSVVNIGRNYTAYQADYALTWFFARSWELSSLFKLIYNDTNHDTGYQSGVETNVDYALNYHMPNNWFAGVGGYWHEQFTNDTLHGQTYQAGNRVRDFAIGPQFGYGTPKIGAYLSWQHQVYVRNTTKGDAVWLNTFIKF